MPAAKKKDEAPVVKVCTMYQHIRSRTFAAVDSEGVREKSPKWSGPYKVAITNYPDGRVEYEQIDFKPVIATELALLEDEDTEHGTNPDLAFDASP